MKDMTKIQQLKKTLKRIESLESLIDGANLSISSFERVFKNEEISIQDNIEKTAPIFLTGERKDKILAILIEEKVEWRKKWEQELKEIEQSLTNFPIDMLK